MKDKTEVRKALKEEHEKYDSECGVNITYEGKSVEEIKNETAKLKESCEKLFEDMNAHEKKINTMM